MQLPYTRLVQEINDESGHYFYGRVLEEDYLEIKIDNNLPIPIPQTTDKYSGRFVIRLPKTLHQRLAMEALREGGSLNQLALYKLAL